MANSDGVKEFPQITQKLAAPKGLSAFQKERLLAESKRQKANEENAAALREFESSFADDGDDGFPVFASSGRPPPSGPRGAALGLEGGGGRYGLPTSGLRSGPGSLGPIPGGPPPPLSLKRKRALDEMREAQEAKREQSMFGSSDEREASRRTSHAEEQEEEKEDEAPKPSVHLSSLPPGTTVEELKALLSPSLKVHSVRFLSPAGPGPVGRKSLTAIATLSSDMTPVQLDSAVSSLRDQYMGCGFYLSISRHLSSSTLHQAMTGSISTNSSQPFGAKLSRDTRSKFSMRNAPPPPPDRRGFAPPEYYHPRGPQSKAADKQITVQPPLEISTIRAIHTISDRLLAQKNPDRSLEMEVSLMGLPEVQKDERFAFLYDSKSLAGVYYRFCLWGPDGPDEQKRRARESERLFSDMEIDWSPPYKEIPFPDLTNLAQVVTDIDYASSDEESDDDTVQIHTGDVPDRDAPDRPAEKTFLTPLQRARLTHLLARLPSINTKLRKGDVARVTSYAINHAGNGAEQIVDMLLLNVEKPFSQSLAAKYEDSDAVEAADEDEEYDPDDPLPTIEESASTPMEARKDDGREHDPSNSKLVALYIISDILSASSTAGARNAWKYRQLFEAGFKHHKIFERLGKLDRELGWGRLKAEQWKRKISAIFSIWENWSVFSSDVHEELKTSFLEPPLSEQEKAEAAREEEKVHEREKEQSWMSRFKKVDQSASASPARVPPETPTVTSETAPENVDGEDMDIGGADIDGSAMIDIDGAEMADLDGVPMQSLGGKATASEAMEMETSPAKPEMNSKKDEMVAQESVTKAGIVVKDSQGKPGPRRRMRAEDMFAAESDEE